MRLLRLLVVVAVLVGVALYLREWLAERDRKLHEAEDTVKSALDDLDPIARMQVLKDVAKDVAGG
jgi:HAMP domain-containing protein